MIRIQKNKSFNGEMNLLKMIGIIHVVVSHIYGQLFPIIRQSYTFHMPLFYFISGYFYDEQNESNKLGYIWKKFKKNILSFYLYFLLLIVFCYFIDWKYNVSLGSLSFHTFFISPFTSGLGNPGFLLGATWFITSLFLVQVIFVFLYSFLKFVFKKDFFIFLFFFLLGISSIALSNVRQFRNEFSLMFFRTMIGMMFYYFGYFYKKNIENKWNVFNGKVLVIVVLLISIIWSSFTNLLFGFGNADFTGHLFLPIITSIIGIYLSIFIAKGLNFLIKNDNDILHLIGRNTFYIMTFQFLIFFIISFFYFKFNNIPDSFYSSLTEFPFRPKIIDINKWWPLYVSFGLLLPTLYGELLNKIKKNHNF